MIKRRLHWIRVDKRTIISEEQLDGTPDFIIQSEGTGRYRMKMRTSAKSYYFPSASEAREYAEAI